jgi:hypothetical protein
MAIDQDTMQMLKTESAGAPPVDLSWLDLKQTWGIQAKPGKRGLTLDEVNIGAYGPPGAEAHELTFRPRGAAPREGVPRTGYYLDKKSDVWSDNATLLYEEAVQRQWSSATDIPWEKLEPLPDDIERAFCQLCTFLTEVEFIAGDTPGQWVPKISNEHFETKLFLCSQIMDEGRHLDVFRKRALANGGGLLQASPTSSLRTIINARDFTEMSAIMHVQAEGFVQSMFRMGELIAQNDAEKRIFRLCAQDESRHLGFGVMHMKYVLANEPPASRGDPRLPRRVGKRRPGDGHLWHQRRRVADRAAGRWPRQHRRGLQQVHGAAPAPDQRVHAPPGGGRAG